MKAKSKVKTKDKGKKKTNKRLRLEGPAPDFSHLKIFKNAPLPQGKGSFYWDHLINILDGGSMFVLPKKQAAAFSVRAKKLGYVIVLARLDKEETSVWFGGLKK
jgi:hypothetical protein